MRFATTSNHARGIGAGLRIELSWEEASGEAHSLVGGFFHPQCADEAEAAVSILESALRTGLLDLGYSGPLCLCYRKVPLLFFDPIRLLAGDPNPSFGLENALQAVPKGPTPALPTTTLTYESLTPRLWHLCLTANGQRFESDQFYVTEAEAEAARQTALIGIEVALRPRHAWRRGPWHVVAGDCFGGAFVLRTPNAPGIEVNRAGRDLRAIFDLIDLCAGVSPDA